MAIDINKDISYQLSINVLKALGGNTDVPFESVEEIWDEINKIYDNAGDRLDIEALIMDIRNNGLYEFYPNENADAYAPVRLNVNIPQKYTDEYVEQLGRESFNQGMIEGEEIGYQKGFAEGSDDGYQDGYSEGLDDGAEEQKALMIEETFRENGVFERSDGYRKVTVDIEIPTFETEQLSVELKENGDYNYTPSKDGYDSVSVSVNVPIPEPADLRVLDIEVKDNKSYEYLPTDYDGWNKVNLLVNVPTGGDSGKPKVLNGFRFTGGDLSKVDFSQYDWSGVYDCSYLMSNCDLTNMDWEHFKSNFNGRILAAEYMLGSSSSGNTTNLYTLPNLGEMTKDCVSLGYLCAYNYRVTDVSNIQYWNTSNVTNMEYMFHNCPKLTTVPLFDTSNVTDMSSMLKNCSALTSVPLFDTSNVTTMKEMFQYCGALTTVPLFDTSNVTDMSGMLKNCSALTSVPLFDTSKVTHMGNMFNNCIVLTSVPEFDTSQVTKMNEMFQYCSALTSVPLFDTSNVTTMSSMFYSCSKLTTLGGFINMGKQSSFSAPTLSYSTLLTKESIMNVINNLYDRKSAGYSTITLNFGSTNLAKITDEEKAIATNKGWTLS